MKKSEFESKISQTHEEKAFMLEHTINFSKQLDEEINREENLVNTNEK